MGQAGSRSRRRRSHAHRTEHRSEEHTSELQSQSNLVCRLLLEKKKKEKKNILPCVSLVQIFRLCQIGHVADLAAIFIHIRQQIHTCTKRQSITAIYNPFELCS